MFENSGYEVYLFDIFFSKYRYAYTHSVVVKKMFIVGLCELSTIGFDIWLEYFPLFYIKFVIEKC